MRAGGGNYWRGNLNLIFGKDGSVKTNQISRLGLLKTAGMEGCEEIREDDLIGSFLQACSTSSQENSKE